MFGECASYFLEKIGGYYIIILRPAFFSRTPGSVYRYVSF
jgi:hypothetical protein